MLKILRKKGVAKKILWVITIVIILSFGFFGVAYILTGNKQATSVGKIFAKKVDPDEFQKAYEAVRLQAMMRFGDKFNEISSFLNLESEAWDRLILMQEVKKRGIRIKDDEVVQTISQYAFFQRDGHFDPLLYNDILRYAFHLSARQFEENTRDNLKFAKLFEQETAKVTVNDQEVKDAFNKENEKVQASYILITPDKFKNDVSIQENEAKDYYAKNKNAFLMPPTINVEYINLDSSVTVKDQAEKIFQDLLIDPNMQVISQKYNVKVQMSGFFSQEEPKLSLGWSYEFLNKLFSMTENSVIEPLETPQGIIIAKIKQKKEDYIPEYQEIVDKVKEAVINNKAKEIAFIKTQEYLNQIKEEFEKTKLQDFSETGKKLGFEIHQTPTFSRGEYLPIVGIAKDFQEAAFSLAATNAPQEANLSRVIETEVGYCILHLDSYVPADDKQFEERKQKLTETLLTERRTKTFNDFLNNLRLKANIINNLPQRIQP